MPLSKNEAARDRQLANLKPAAAATHGAHSGALIRDASRERLASLTERFPSAGQEELTVHAVRMAQIERLAAYVEHKGLIRNQRKGDVFPAVEMLARLSTAFERQHALLLEREQAKGNVKPGALLASIVAEIDAENGETPS
jgi:hypothetical protein